MSNFTLRALFLTSMIFFSFASAMVKPSANPAVDALETNITQQGILLKKIVDQRAPFFQRLSIEDQIDQLKFALRIAIWAENPTSEFPDGRPDFFRTAAVTAIRRIAAKPAETSYQAVEKYKKIAANYVLNQERIAAAQQSRVDYVQIAKDIETQTLTASGGKRVIEYCLQSHFEE